MSREHKGSSSEAGFWATAVERHEVWQRRARGESWPWTDDEIFKKFKFTNVFRELDAGTLALRRMLPTHEWDDSLRNRGLVVFNVAWYRMFNRAEHAESPGYVAHAAELEHVMRRKKSEGQKVFTGCHMHSGDLEGNLATLGAIFRERDFIAECCKHEESLLPVFRMLTTTYNHIGPFIGYEIVTDLRHYRCLWPAADNAPRDFNVWANVGPGSRRGMERLGMPPTLASMRELLGRAEVATRGTCLHDHVTSRLAPRFELREVEHWLCEFDKYERARTGQGVPKQVYRPRNS